MKPTRNPQNKKRPGKKIAPTKQAASKPAAVPQLSRKAKGYFVLSFFIFAVLLYGNTIFNGYAIDDNNVTNNELVKKGFSAIPEIFATRYNTQQGNIGATSADYRPVVKATFAIEYQLWGEKPGRSHAVNILIYWLASVLVFFTLRRLFQNFNILFTFLITLVFMAHPVHTEVVASLKNRDELLAFTAGIGALWFILNYSDTRKTIHLLYAFLIFIAGYLSKSSILPFLLIYPLALYFFTKMPVKKLMPVFLIILFAVLLAQYVPKMFLAPFQRSTHYIENPLFFEKSIWLRLGTGFITLWFYLKLLFYPQPLLYYYGYNMIPVTNLANFWVWISLAIHAALLFFAIRKFREKNILSFAIFYYFIALSMYSNFLKPVVGIVGERFAFNASLAFSIALVYLIFMLFKTDPRRLTIEMDARLKILLVIVLLIIPGTVLSINRNRTWRNTFVLYRHDIKSLENSAKANLDYAGYLMGTVYQDPNFLGKGLVNQLKYFYITHHFRKALELYPENYLANNDLGTVYLFIGKNYDSAVYFLKKAIALDSTLQPAWVNLGMAYRYQTQYQKAIECYEHILRMNPREVKAVFALADVYNDLGDFNRAVKMNEEVMKAYPNLEMPYVNIGNYYMLKTDTVTAVRYWEKAASINPTYELCVQLNSLYQIRGDHAKANYYYDLGMRIINQTRH